MMASERELELSDEHNGIIELPSGEVGQRFTDWLAANAPEKIDPMIHIKITPNRPDALGVHGVARDLAARGLGTLKAVTVDAVPGAFPCPVGVTIDAGVAAKAPFFAGRVVRGVTNGPSPAWLQKRLRAIGLRPINALVDITNFFTFDLNRPLHVFDAGKVAGDLILRGARAGEELVALDDKTYALPEGAVVICDANGPESIAGIMGGAASGSTDETTDVFIEAAYFDPISTAATGRALKINSDARYRFERGIVHRVGLGHANDLEVLAQLQARHVGQPLAAQHAAPNFREALVGVRDDPPHVVHDGRPPVPLGEPAAKLRPLAVAEVVVREDRVPRRREVRGERLVPTGVLGHPVRDDDDRPRIAFRRPLVDRDGPAVGSGDRRRRRHARHPRASATAAGSWTSTPSRSIHQVIARNIAPVSR